MKTITTHTHARTQDTTTWLYQFIFSSGREGGYHANHGASRKVKNTEESLMAQAQAKSDKESAKRNVAEGAAMTGAQVKKKDIFPK